MASTPAPAPAVVPAPSTIRAAAAAAAQAPAPAAIPGAARTVRVKRRRTERALDVITVEQATGRNLKRLPVADLFAGLTTSEDASPFTANPFAGTGLDVDGGSSGGGGAGSGGGRAAAAPTTSTSGGPKRFRYKRVRTVSRTAAASSSPGALTKRGRRSGKNSPGSQEPAPALPGPARPGPAQLLQRDGITLERVVVAPLSDYEKLFDLNIFEAFTSPDLVTRSVQMLDKAPAMVDFQRRLGDETTLLMAAARWGDEQAVEHLITKLKADATLRDVNGLTAMDIAAKFGHHAAAAALQKHTVGKAATTSEKGPKSAAAAAAAAVAASAAGDFAAMSVQQGAQCGATVGEGDQHTAFSYASSDGAPDDDYDYDVYELADDVEVAAGGASAKLPGSGSRGSSYDDEDSPQFYFYVSEFFNGMLLDRDDAVLDEMTSDDDDGSSAGSDSNHENYYANEYPDEESVDTEDYEDHRHFDEYGSDDEDGTSSNDSFN